MSAKKSRKRAYIPPSHEVVNRRERTESTRTLRTSAPRANRTPGTAAREIPPPSWSRTLKRLPIYALLIFGMQFYLLGQEHKLDTQHRLIAAAGFAAVITLCFAPFMHMMDRMAYNRQQKRTGNAEPKS
jgi:hypothetical protein